MLNELKEKPPLITPHPLECPHPPLSSLPADANFIYLFPLPWHQRKPKMARNCMMKIYIKPNSCSLPSTSSLAWVATTPKWTVMPSALLTSNHKTSCTAKRHCHQLCPQCWLLWKHQQPDLHQSQTIDWPHSFWLLNGAISKSQNECNSYSDSCWHNIVISIIAIWLHHFWHCIEDKDTNNFNNYDDNTKRNSNQIFPNYKPCNAH